ncbi:MAG: PHP domain-containing protein [Oscillospiraceae bacterium]|nr:PHP domain-containing protein [Oscillospiraceae bacterium]
MNTPIADYHIHSKWSFDSESSLESIYEKAIQKGLKHIAITEHCFLVQEHMVQLLDRWGYVSNNGFNTDLDVLFGVELSLENKEIMWCLRNGVFGFWDIISGGVHGFEQYNLYPKEPISEYRNKFLMLPEKVEQLVRQYVAQTVTAINTGQLDVLVHPWDIFLLAGCTDQILLKLSHDLVKQAALHNTFIELNGGMLKNIYYLSAQMKINLEEFYVRFLQICSGYDVKFVYGSDAHEVDEIGVPNFLPAIKSKLRFAAHSELTQRTNERRNENEKLCIL